MKYAESWAELIWLFKAATLSFQTYLTIHIQHIPQLSQQTGKFWMQNKMQKWKFASTVKFQLRQHSWFCVFYIYIYIIVLKSLNLDTIKCLLQLWAAEVFPVLSLLSMVYIHSCVTASAELESYLLLALILCGLDSTRCLNRSSEKFDPYWYDSFMQLLNNCQLHIMRQILLFRHIINFLFTTDVVLL